MFVRNLSRNCSPQKKLHISMCLSFFFHFCRKEKWKKKTKTKQKRPSTDLEEERGKKGGWRKMLRRQGPLGLRCPFFPFTRSARLLVQDGSVPFWHTSFLDGAVVKQCIVGQERQAFVFFATQPPTPVLFCFCFLLLPYLNFYFTWSGDLHWSWCRCVYFYAVSLPLLLFW